MKEIFLSKKFQATVFATIILIAGKWGLQLDNVTLGIIASPFLTFIGSQAYVDSKVNTAVIEQATAVDNNNTNLKIAAINNADTTSALSATRSVAQILKAVEDKPKNPSPVVEVITEKALNQ